MAHVIAGKISPVVTRGPAIVHGKPVIAGARVLVSRIVGHLTAGDSIKTACSAYVLSAERVRAALGFAAT